MSPSDNHRDDRGADQSQEEPFDPYAPPPPGQLPQRPGYGPPPQGPSYGAPLEGPGHGQPPPGHGYYYPQGYQDGYAPAPRQSAKPLWLGALLGVLGVGAVLWVGWVTAPDAVPWLLLALVVAMIVLSVVPATRRWGLGLLIGLLLSIPIGLIIFAGVCIALIASYSQSGA